MDSQTYDKRTRFHNEIRVRQRQNYRKTLRTAFLESQNKINLNQLHNTHNQNPSNTPHKRCHQSINTLNYIQSLSPKTTHNSKQIIQKLLNTFNTDSNEPIKYQDGKIRRLGSQEVGIIWQVVVQHSSQVCLSQGNMRVLIFSAKEDVRTLISTVQLANDKAVVISWRLDHIIWTLLNQCSKSPQISVTIVQQITQLCLSIFNICQQKKNTSPGVCLPDPSLSVLLLGNICVNQQHVTSILSLVKLNKLISILDEILESKCYEDLSFMLSNMLYYYPDQLHDQIDLGEQICEQNKGDGEDMQKINQEMLIKVKEEEFELLQVLWNLYGKLAQDMLITANTSIKKTDTYQTPSKIHTKQKHYNSVSKKKINKNDYALLSMEEKERITWLIENKYCKTKLSNIYTHDLMECINKIKHILLELKGKEVMLVGCMRWGNNGIVQELVEACRKLEEEVSSKEKYTTVLIIRILHYQSQQMTTNISTYSLNFPNQRQKISFMTTFLRDIFRYFQSPNPRQHRSKTSLEVQQYIMSCKCEQLLKYINKQILVEKDYPETQKTPINKYLNRNIEDQIVDSLWEIYGYMMKYMTRNRENKNMNQVEYGNLCQRELEILEDKLVKIHFDQEYQDKLCSQEATGLNMLAEYYLIANEMHEKIQLELQKIQNLLNFLKNKLIEHTEAPTLIFAILRAIQTVVKRVRHYMTGFSDDEESGYAKTKRFNNKDLLGQELYQIIYTKLSKYGDETAIGSQISEIRSQLLNQAYQIELQQRTMEQ